MSLRKVMFRSMAAAWLISTFLPIWLVEWAGEREIHFFVGNFWQVLAAPGDLTNYVNVARLLEHYAPNLLVLALVLLVGAVAGLSLSLILRRRSTRTGP